MKKTLPRSAALLLALVLAVCCAVGLGQTPQPAAPAPGAAGGPAQAGGGPASAGPKGDLLLEHVVANLEAAPSISAKIRHRVELLGRPISGVGEYAQQGRGPGRRFRLALDLRTQLSATTIEHTCDGQQLWLNEEFDGKRSLSTVNVARLQNSTPKVGSSPQTPMWWLSLGGLPKLAVSLKDSFHFGEVVANRLDALAVWSVEGQWRPERLAQLLPEQAEAIKAGQGADLSKLTPNVPHKVVLHVGYDDLFPYRIEYWRTETDDKGVTTEKLMLVMEWYEVRIGSPIEPARFLFQPPQQADPQAPLQPTDRTQEWLDRLGRQDPPPVEAARRPRTRL
jgi:hypothetical protein